MHPLPCSIHIRKGFSGVVRTILQRSEDGFRIRVIITDHPRLSFKFRRGDNYAGTGGYPGYESFCKKYRKITHAECWTHSRRYFIKSEKAESEATKEALDLIGQVYKVEDDIRKLELEGDKKRDYRQQKAKPLVDQLFTWNREQLRCLDLVPSHPLSKALGYVQKREMELRVYLDDPSADIDTYHQERALRCIPMGRKNWMFCWTLEGASSAAGRCYSS